MSRQQREREKVDTRIYTAWTEGKWIIEGAFGQIMKQLARWYDVAYFIKNAEAKDCVHRGFEKYSNCNVILDIIYP